MMVISFTVGASVAVNNNIFFLSTIKDLDPDRNSADWEILVFNAGPLEKEASFSISPGVLGRYVAVYSESTRTSTKAFVEHYDEPGGILGMSELRIMGIKPGKYLWPVSVNCYCYTRIAQLVKASICILRIAGLSLTAGGGLFRSMDF